jgi:hypothetical protein
MNDKTHNDEAALDVRGNVLDAIRQWWFPAEFRIAAPALPVEAVEEVEQVVEAPSPAAPSAPVAESPAPAAKPSAPDGAPTPDELVAGFANCLWYLKTKHFKRAWEDPETGDDDPRVRRALGRLNKSAELLEQGGVEVHDPTNQRYPAGGEGMMRPIQFLPTAGLTFEMVSETVLPIIYRHDRLIQRGEVFVSVPKEEGSASDVSNDH